MYRRQRWQAGPYEVVKVSRSARIGGKKRNKKEKPTREAVAKQNQRLRREKLQLLIMANFTEGDLFVTLTYRKEDRPSCIDEAKKNVAAFLRKLKRRMEKAGQEIKWILTTEIGAKGGCHHHLVINSLPGIQEAMRELWTCSPTPRTEHLYSDGAYSALADYIVKTETKEKVPGTRYSRSRNLVVPEPKEEIMKRDSWPEEPKARKGWYVVKESVVNGVNPVTGYPYQRYVMARLPQKERRERDKEGS